MGIKKLFKIKPEEEPTALQNREELMDAGLAVKPQRRRTDKFNAFRDYAMKKNENRPQFLPRTADGLNDGNLYANNGYNRSYNDLNNRDGQNDVYSANHFKSDSDILSSRGGGYQESPYTAGNNTLSRFDTNQTSQTDRNRGGYLQQQQQQQLLQEQQDNAYNNSTYGYSESQVGMLQDERRQGVEDEEEDLNEVPYGDYHQQFNTLSPQEQEAIRQQREEDEAVDEIKRDIRFTKQQSVASTRNTMRMAQEATVSGQNTLGMLGSQSERLYNIERNLALAETQNKIADDKVKELARLNRSLFAVHAPNPFTSKRRLRDKEEKIKTQRLNEKLLQDKQRATMFSSERRVIDGLRTTNSDNTALYNKYNNQKILADAKRYQFENDEEDDEMELEIGNNLHTISQHASSLKQMANTIGKEVRSQNSRMRNIEEDTDTLDINVHLNNSRLSGLH
ncbi:hypothetical protein PACTADRAFT_47952 [Pachysolen tannophilus NRRL Y-2460]|uniref:t-SNARE coiled-coil homology domain-containing protein n=1 Tax=Pachysolen tannophilus NRRL Y-2460 TaxID=669874 RepID=A0A1E4U2B7_PACTA|nr:hypothetical protein PACTADRAFT_47952 [Pachysolen tannophilus NRRL Y-2460]